MPNLWNARECNKILQNVMVCRYLIHKMLQNAEAETMEYYKMIYKLSLTLAFRNILLHSVY